MNALEIGIDAARNARRQDAADSLLLKARERALEVAMESVSKLGDLEPMLLRDATTRLLSELELECRSKALMLAAVMRCSGLPTEHPLFVELTARALR